ncbi:MAG TPA: hypothetical protein VM261_30615 [Kofleriaceae bacterium]|nr:hypothetical protein [Kofleriaceae bacterium]
MVGLASVALAACASSAALRAAKDARYAGPRSAMLEVVAETVNARSDLRVQRLELERGLVVTSGTGRFLDGTEEPRADGSTTRSLVVTRFEIALVGSANGYRVEVTPVMLLRRPGYPAPVPLAAGDPQTPGWVVGKTEKLTLAIYDALADFRVDATKTASAAR